MYFNYLQTTRKRENQAGACELHYIFYAINNYAVKLMKHYACFHFVSQQERRVVAPREYAHSRNEVASHTAKHASLSASVNSWCIICDASLEMSRLFRNNFTRHFIDFI